MITILVLFKINFFTKNINETNEEKNYNQNVLKEKYIDFKTLRDFLRNNEKAIVIITQENCSYCTIYENTIEQLNDNEFIFYYEYENITQELLKFLEIEENIIGTPTTIIINNNKILEIIPGALELEKLKEKINQYFRS